MIPAISYKKFFDKALELGFTVNVDGLLYSPFTKEWRTGYNNNGYYEFKVPTELSEYHSRQKRLRVHRFQGYIKYHDRIFENGFEIRHVNGNSLDNSWDNIVLGTPSENHLDKPKEVRERVSINASEKNRVFTDVEMDEIREYHNSCRSYKKVMDRFGITSKGSLNYMLNVEYKTKKSSHGSVATAPVL